MKIALYHNLPSGGAKRVVYESVRRLAARHQVDLFCPETANQAFCDVRPFVTNAYHYPFQVGRTFARPFGRLNRAVWLADLRNLEALSRRIAAEIDARGYDVVLVHPCLLTQAPSVLPHLRTRSVYFCQEILRGQYEQPIPRPYHQSSRLQVILDRVDPAFNLHRLVLRRIDRRNIRAATRVLTNSTFTATAARQVYGVDAHVNWLGVDTELFRPLGIAKAKRVVSLGALKPEKGFDFLIASLATIPGEKRPGLDLISNFEIPAERTYLQGLASALGVDVAFHLDIPNDDVVAQLNRAQVMAYAPVAEPFGLASIEAQSCGTPVVGVAEGGVRDTVMHEQTGLLIQRDPVAFGQAIESLLDDPERRDRFGRNARSSVLSRWNWEASVADLENILEDVVGRSIRSPVVVRRAGHWGR